MSVAPSQIESAGLNSIKMMRMSRHRAPKESHRGEHLGKDLSHHQVVSATKSTDAGHTANRPHVLVRNSPISSTGGLRGASTHHTHSGMGVFGAVSHHANRQAQRRGMFVSNPAHATKGK